MNEEAFVALWYWLEDIILNMEPIIYQKYITVNNGHTFLYDRLKKELYGLLRSALLLYEKTAMAVYSKGLFINPCEPYTTNITIHMEKMMITLHINNLKISHFEQTKDIPCWRIENMKVS